MFSFYKAETKPTPPGKAVRGSSMGRKSVIWVGRKSMVAGRCSVAGVRQGSAWCADSDSTFSFTTTKCHVAHTATKMSMSMSPPTHHHHHPLMRQQANRWGGVGCGWGGRREGEERRQYTMV